MPSAGADAQCPAPTAQRPAGLISFGTMSLMRTLLLRGSESAWLRAHAPQWPFVRRATRRFMPGERVEDALAAAAARQAIGIGAVFTRLGENLAAAADADAVAGHYLALLDRIGADRTGAEIAVKPTQLGLDFSRERCEAHLLALAARAAARGTWLWIDMESTAYTDPTLELYRRVRARHEHVGVCLQSYLRRTPADLDALVRLGGHVRLVKGAYREPPDKAYPVKRDVDEAYFVLATKMLGPDARRAGMRAIFATHDTRLIERIEAHAGAAGLQPQQVEFQMLYGIQPAAQRRLAAEGRPVRVLIAYGEAWFAWYMRRLAERPANVWFVARNLVSS